MRQVILDTETTGLDPAQGHRIIEIGCIELIDRRPTGNRYHQYLQPDREIDDGAIEVHGITNEFLADKPRFADIAEDFRDFIQGGELVIHNAPFDVGFLNHELLRLGTEWGKIENYCALVDTLLIARQLHPGQKNSLDALCKRYHIDNSQRTFHGALHDAEILVDVYLAMTGGQGSLLLDGVHERAVYSTRQIKRLDPGRPPLRVIRASEQERAQHEKQLALIDQDSGGHCVWRRLDS